MTSSDLRLYRSPFSAAYWRAARRELGQTRSLAFSALMIGACWGLSMIPSVLFVDAYGARLTWGFLARSTCSMVCGPVVGVVFGLAEDTITFFLSKPTAPYFPGYTLSTMLGNLIYALFLYRTRFGLGKVFFAKLATNLLNVFLGSLWSAILGGKGYLFYMITSAEKNTVLLPIQTVMLCVLFAALTPILQNMGWLPPGGGWKGTEKKKHA